MKYNTIISLGVLAIAVIALILLANSESYEKTARNQFGTPAAIHALRDLYTRLEKEGNTLGRPGEITRPIPQSWVPSEFTEKWSHFFSDVGQVVAHFDNQDNPVAIEFDGSRYGCYISRDPKRCPSSFTSLHRLAFGSLYITSRVGCNEESKGMLLQQKIP
jgi:hypothetical protein